MCGVACVLDSQGQIFIDSSRELLQHRGPDNFGVYDDNNIKLLHTRLSILDLSAAGSQPMKSDCGRYIISYNGEVYNHLELRKQYLADYRFKGYSDTETILALFARFKEKMLDFLTGMWSILIWDTHEESLFVCRDRYGQKPLYYRKWNGAWYFSSEIAPLLFEDVNLSQPTAVAEFLALGNYGHLGPKTFFNAIEQFPPGCYSVFSRRDNEMKVSRYWSIPNIAPQDKRPFDDKMQKQLHDTVVQSVLSQTLSDVPIAVTLSGGIDSSIITGILATYLDRKIHVFTAQSKDAGKYSEADYVNAVVNKYGNKLDVQWLDLRELSLKNDLRRFIKVQEEPFGDPSIIAHGNLMELAAQTGIKVILGGQGADELFFGYTNMVHAVLLKQFRSFDYRKYFSNLHLLDLSKKDFSRIILQSLFPGLERQLRIRSRQKRRNVLKPDILAGVDNSLFTLPNYKYSYDVWVESIYGIHLPHLVHYDDRNAMSVSIEGRMPFLDHRLAECVAQIKIEDLFKDGMRKYPLRVACKSYIPDEVYNRRDKIGFYTPLIHSIYKDETWIIGILQKISWVKHDVLRELSKKIQSKKLTVNDALLIWRFASCALWVDQFNVKFQ